MNAPSNDQLNDFEQALLPELRGYVALRGAETTQTTGSASRQRRWGTRVGLAATAAAAAAIASVSLLGGGGAAYAVDAADDGAITVKILDRSDAAGLEAALAEHGITADVDYSGESAVSILEGADGDPELVPTDDTPPPNAEPVRNPEPLPTVVTVSSGDKPCPGTAGGTQAPIAMKRSGGGFVIRLTGAAAEEGADLHLAIFAGGYTEGVAGIYTDGGLTCGASTIWGAEG